MIRVLKMTRLEGVRSFSALIREALEEWWIFEVVRFRKVLLKKVVLMLSRHLWL